MADERCWLCAFWDGNRCTQTFRMVILMTPTGGQVDFSTVPGMVPEELKDRVIKVMSRFLEKALPAIEALSIWDEIREFQLANLPERADCPSKREPSEEIKRDYLKLVKL